MNTKHELANEIRQLIDLLDQEIKLIQEGELNSLPEILPKKVELVRSLENKSDQLDALIAHDNDETKEIRELLTQLRSLTKLDSRLISRMASSVKDILRDAFGQGGLERLDGLYDSQGRTNTNSGISFDRFDRSL